MSVQAYVPSEVQFDGAPINGTRLITLYHVETDDRHGSVTTSEPLAAGTQGGPLEFVGSRDGKTWRVSIPRISVRNKSAMGFEYDIDQPIHETLLSEDGDDKRGPVQKSLSDYGATF